MKLGILKLIISGLLPAFLRCFFDNPGNMICFCMDGDTEARCESGCFFLAKTTSYEQIKLDFADFVGKINSLKILQCLR